jgi:hypothetical protein
MWQGTFMILHSRQKLIWYLTNFCLSSLHVLQLVQFPHQIIFSSGQLYFTVVTYFFTHSSTMPKEISTRCRRLLLMCVFIHHTKEQQSTQTKYRLDR